MKEENNGNWRVRFRELDEYEPTRLVYGPGGLITVAAGFDSPQQVKPHGSGGKSEATNTKGHSASVADRDSD